MQVVSKFMMFMMAVSNMPKAKEFYADTLGLEITKDYRQDDDNWWVELVTSNKISVSLSTQHGHMKPGTSTVYFATSDIKAAHKELSDKGVEVSDIQHDLHGPGSGTEWFECKDPDGNQVFLEQE